MSNESIYTVARDSLQSLFGSALTDVQAHDMFNSILIHYDERPAMSFEFFKKYFRAEAFKSVDAFAKAVRNYQRDAIRIFNSFSAAYERLNTCESLEIGLSPLAVRDDSAYRARTPWEVIEVIPDERLPNLGYIAARLIEQEKAEQQAISTFLKELSESIQSDGPVAVSRVSEKKRRKMDGLLRKFNSTIQHGFLSRYNFVHR